VDDRGDLTGTSWGRTPLVKLAAVAATVAVGTYNHFVVVPKLERAPGDPANVQRVRTTLAIETFVLVYVVIATAFLVGASTN
jgi:putative copper export protein